MVSFLILFLTSFVYAKQCDVIVPDIVSQNSIALNAFGKTKACLKSMAYAPTTPGFPKLYFQKLGDKEDFTLFCNKGDKEFTRILFLEDDGILSLKLPVYNYMIGIDHTNLPRNIVHFKHQNKDLYIEFKYADVANIITAETLPKLAADMMVSMSKIKNEYILKYETWLKTQKMELAIIPSNPDESETKVLLSCLEEKQQEIVESYLRSKFSFQFPPYGTMVDDANNSRSLSVQEKAKYQRPWSDLEAEFLADIKKTLPDCDGIVNQDSVIKAFGNTFKKNKELYENIRKALF